MGSIHNILLICGKMYCRVICMWKSLTVSNSLRPHGLYSPWNSPGQNTGVCSLSLLQGIFPTQGLKPGFPHCRQILYQLSHKGSPRILEWVAYPLSKGSSQPRNRTGVSCIAGGFFTNWAMQEAQRYMYNMSLIALKHTHEIYKNKVVKGIFKIFRVVIVWQEDLRGYPGGSMVKNPPVNAGETGDSR